MAHTKQPAVILFLTHQWSLAIAERFARLFRETQSCADCVLLLQDDGGEISQHWRTFLSSMNAEQALHLFSAADLPERLGYPYLAQSIVPGSAHFPVLDFWREWHYAYYWLIEGDVEYRGDWQALISSFETSGIDLFGSHFRRYADLPTWVWWPSLSLPTGISVPPDALRKVFLPVYRISNAGLQAMDAAHQAGWRGHVEVLYPTVLYRQGLSMADFRSVMPCIEGQSQDPCKAPAHLSTMRWRPAIQPMEFLRRGERHSLLFHPVKGDWYFDGQGIVRTMRDG